eukprot:scaffold32882_cov29-Tisochrysis_lutea.AAC.1
MQVATHSSQKAATDAVEQCPGSPLVAPHCGDSLLSDLLPPLATATRALRVARARAVGKETLI